jgi:branched-chain amino acid transport system permease protein
MKIGIQEIKKSFFISLWFMVLTFPLMVIKVNTIENVINWRWSRLIFIGVGIFVISLLWNYFMKRRDLGVKRDSKVLALIKTKLEVFKEKRVKYPSIVIFGILVLAFPFISSLYQTNIMITALNYIILGLGLNIVVGLGGILNLGHAAFYMVGAYSYALLNYHFGLNFWLALPIGGAVGAIFGILVASSVIRLRGDYLAIVTLAFGEILRIVMENWNAFSFGPSGIANIPRPTIFNIDFKLSHATIFIYFLMLVLVLLTIFIANRLENSRMGRAWVAMREDETASQAMGINTSKVKLMTFAIGAFFAGIAGVMFAAKTTFINPSSFTVWESIIVLCIVVLGGMGSTLGVIIAALLLVLLPEYLRVFSEYRMLMFGMVLVVMMVFRPQGIVAAKRKLYTFASGKEAGDE